MTDTYAVGIHETGADFTLYITAEAPDNKTFYTALAETLIANAEGSFSVADVLYDLKRESRVTGVHVGDIMPKSDHTIHEFNEAGNSISLLDKDTFVVKHTFDLWAWAARYDVF